MPSVGAPSPRPPFGDRPRCPARKDVVGRRDELDRTKHFFCECARCVTVTAEPDSGFGVLDAQVSGILCQACGAGRAQSPVMWQRDYCARHWRRRLPVGAPACAGPPGPLTGMRGRSG